MKTCTKCEIEKPLSEFYKYKTGRNGFLARCKSCLREYKEDNKEKIKKQSANYYIDNKKIIQKVKKKWRVNNREETKEYQANNRERIQKVKREYYVNNKEKIKEYRMNNKEKIQKQNKEYINKNRSLINAQVANRRTTKLERSMKWANKLAIEYIYWLAKQMAVITGVQYHVDHIVPLQGKLVSGLHIEHNLQIIPASINAKKHNKFTGE